MQKSIQRIPRFAIITLGCKVNSADSDSLIRRLKEKARQVSFKEYADLYIVNSCTVTAIADRQSRQLVYRAKRQNPNAKVVLTGCMVAKETLQRHNVPSQVDRFFSPSEHRQLLDFVMNEMEQVLKTTSKGKILQPAGKAPSIPNDPRCVSKSDKDEQFAPNHRARPFLKIQDGCNLECSYCIVRLARGQSRSTLCPTEVFERLACFAGKGIREVVLTGIHLGLYGQDLHPPLTLAESLHDWLDQLDKSGHRLRLRLSSIEPQEVDLPLIDLIANETRLCCHLHLPIQSGDDDLLAVMNRPYRSERVWELLQTLRGRFSDLAIGTDLIIGFPGETEKQFERTLSLVTDSPLTHIHTFVYSPRPKTVAAGFPESTRVPKNIARARSRALRIAGREKLSGFATSQLGKEREVLVERRRDDGLLTGLSDNYLRVAFEGSDRWIGELIFVQLLYLEKRDDIVIVGEA